MDRIACTATHESGLVYQFKKAGDGAWDGEAIYIPDDIGQAAPRLASEAGAIYVEAMGEQD